MFAKLYKDNDSNTWAIYSFFREYEAIDDVDIDLHINISFLDVSLPYCI